MREVARALHVQIFDHCQAGHVPFRCQEASAKGRPHRRVVHPLAGTLSIDTAGMALIRMDTSATSWWERFTWLRPVGGEDDPDDQPLEDGEEVPMVEEAEPAEDKDVEVVGEDLPLPRHDGLHGDPQEGQPPRAEGPEGEPGEPGEPGPSEGDVEESEELAINVFRLCIAIKTKTAKEALKAMNQMHLQLRAAGYNVVRLHSDRGGEFRGHLDDWCLARGVIRSKTGGVDPHANGRAERWVQEVKARIQRVLLGAGMECLQWPMACRYVHEQE